LGFLLPGLSDILGGGNRRLMGEPLTYTVPQAAALLGISSWSYYECVKRGELPARKIGRRIVVPRVQLEQWLSGKE
jgi:excisionase family DNA binding protein